jgi:hypothetical protein
MSLPGVQEWLDAFHASDAKVWCEDPESMIEKLAGGFVTKKYYTFRILLRSLGRDIIGVRHRFSEFETMRNAVKARFCQMGIAVPALPPKQLLFDDPAFIKERTHALSLMCQDIVASPWLRNDTDWIEFMRSGSGGSAASANLGESMLMLAFAQLEPPQNGYSRMCEFKDELLLVERQLVQLVAAAKANQATLDALDKNHQQLFKCFTEWADVENGVPKLNGEVYGSPKECLLSNSSKALDSVQAYGNVLRSQVCCMKVCKVLAVLKL